MAIEFPNLDDSTLRALEQAAEDAKRFSREIENAFGSNLADISTLNETLANMSALGGTPRVADLQSQFAELAAFGNPPDLSIDLLGGIPLASEILDSHAKLGQDLASLATMRTAITDATESYSSISAAVEAQTSLVAPDASTSIQEILQGFEASGLLGTQRIVEEFGALGLARGLQDQVNALASSVDPGIGTSFPSFDTDIIRGPVYRDFDDQDDNDVGVEELPAPPRSIVRVVHYCDDVLAREGFEGASDEFGRAVSRYENGETKEAMAWSLNALESTLKTICDRRGWPYPKRATASKLIEIVFTHKLVGKAHQTQFGALRSLLESGLPTVANPFRHGQGSFIVAAPDHVAAFALHLCASNIVFLVECYRALPKQ